MHNETFNIMFLFSLILLRINFTKKSLDARIFNFWYLIVLQQTKVCFWKIEKKLTLEGAIL